MGALYYINPEINARRFYSVWVEQDLFGESILIRNWGRIGTSGVTKIERHENLDDALRFAGKLIRRKMAKGYSELRF